MPASSLVVKSSFLSRKRYVLGSTDPVTLDQDDSMRRGSLLPGTTAFPAAAAAARSGPAASPTDEALRSRAPGVAPAHVQVRRHLDCHASSAHQCLQHQQGILRSDNITLWLLYLLHASIPTYSFVQSLAPALFAYADGMCTSDIRYQLLGVACFPPPIGGTQCSGVEATVKNIYDRSRRVSCAG